MISVFQEFNQIRGAEHISATCGILSFCLDPRELVLDELVAIFLEKSAAPAISCDDHRVTILRKNSRSQCVFVKVFWSQPGSFFFAHLNGINTGAPFSPVAYRTPESLVFIVNAEG
jgi:hypothetical protein